MKQFVAGLHAAFSEVVITIVTGTPSPGRPTVISGHCLCQPSAHLSRPFP